MNQPNLEDYVKDMKDNTGKVNHLGRYVPSGLHPCPACKTYDDPRRVSIFLENNRKLILCWDCAAPDCLEILQKYFTPEEIDPEVPGSGSAYPRHPNDGDVGATATQRPKLPSNHPKVLRENSGGSK